MGGTLFRFLLVLGLLAGLKFLANSPGLLSAVKQGAALATSEETPRTVGDLLGPSSLEKSPETGQNRIRFLDRWQPKRLGEQKESEQSLPDEQHNKEAREPPVLAATQTILPQVPPQKTSLKPHPSPQQLKNSPSESQKAVPLATSTGQACSKVLGVPFEKHFRAAAQKHRVPLALLVAVAKQESSFRPTVKSSAGAAGIMQLLPGTAREMGLVVKGKVDQRLKADLNILAGARYLNWLLDACDRKVPCALAGYHSGPMFAALWGGVPPPSRDYVKKVQAYERQFARDGLCKTPESGALR